MRVQAYVAWRANYKPTNNTISENNTSTSSESNNSEITSNNVNTNSEISYEREINNINAKSSKSEKSEIIEKIEKMNDSAIKIRRNGVDDPAREIVHQQNVRESERRNEWRHGELEKERVSARRESNPERGGYKALVS